MSLLETQFESIVQLSSETGGASDFYDNALGSRELRGGAEPVVFKRGGELVAAPQGVGRDLRTCET